MIGHRDLPDPLRPGHRVRTSSRRPSVIRLALQLPAILVGLWIGTGTFAGGWNATDGWNATGDWAVDGPGAVDVAVRSPDGRGPGITRTAVHWPGSSPTHALQEEGFAEAPVVFGQGTPTSGPTTTVGPRVDPRGLAHSSEGIGAAATAARIARDRLLRAGRTGAPATAPPHAPLSKIQTVVGIRR